MGFTARVGCRFTAAYLAAPFVRLRRPLPSFRTISTYSPAIFRFSLLFSRLLWLRGTIVKIYFRVTRGRARTRARDMTVDLTPLRGGHFRSGCVSPSPATSSPVLAAHTFYRHVLTPGFILLSPLCLAAVTFYSYSTLTLTASPCVPVRLPLFLSPFKLTHPPYHAPFGLVASRHAYLRAGCILPVLWFAEHVHLPPNAPFAAWHSTGSR